MATEEHVGGMAVGRPLGMIALAEVVEDFKGPITFLALSAIAAVIMTDADAEVYTTIPAKPMFKTSRECGSQIIELKNIIAEPH